ncbi:e3 ubiquitin-protein ligase topor [Limosa lapponica baueri]|uniref:E3 ubiquitin-protein ligase topor n=1 Tax=Limosa lapponica baueri TaxID=1758121 RepID=A0A2I0U0G4_LIMLA|nr:e3 ubiquitin-protein ligase topor [Limosa lapponica baueri]
MLSILHSVRTDNDFEENVITPSVTPSLVVHQVGRAPCHPATHDLHHPGAPQWWAVEGVSRHYMGGLLPEEWVILFWYHPILLETLLLWIQPRLRQIFRNNQMEVDMVGDYSQQHGYRYLFYR